jgi:hypothetical protein
VRLSQNRPGFGENPALQVILPELGLLRQIRTRRLFPEIFQPMDLGHFSRRQSDKIRNGA